jgi:hypothetical protein
MATRLVPGPQPTVPDLDGSLDRFEHSMTGTDALDKETSSHFAGRLALYRTLVAAIKQISSESRRVAEEQPSFSSKAEKLEPVESSC